MHAFDVFPAIIWEEMLDRLDTPLKKMNLIKIIPSLELLDVFQEKGTEWHFSAVLEILLGHLYRKNERPGTWQENKPWHRRGALKSAVLNCRLVSKCVVGTVDNFVDFYWNTFDWLPPFTAPEHFNSLKHVDKCLEHANNLNGRRSHRQKSPFICGGLLHIHCGIGGNIDGDGSALPSLVKVVELVSHPNIGNNLRGIRMMMNYLVDDLQGTYNFLRKLLESAPNVLILSISFYAIGNELEVETVELPDTHFPELPRLKHLEFHDFIRFDGNSLIRDHIHFQQYFEQLTGLEITFFLWKEQYNDQGLVKFPKLKSILFSDVPISGWNENLLEIVENLNAPALECFSLETRNFDLTLDLLNHESFVCFVSEEVPMALLWRRRTQCWELEQRQVGPVENLVCTYIFSRSQLVSKKCTE